MTKLNLKTRVCRQKDILSSSVDQETVLLSIEKSKYYGMDPIGSSIWQLLETPVTLENIIISLQKQYDVDHDQCKDDVFEFMEFLLKSSLITLANE